MKLETMTIFYDLTCPECDQIGANVSWEHDTESSDLYPWAACVQCYYHWQPAIAKLLEAHIVKLGAELLIERQKRLDAQTWARLWKQLAKDFRHDFFVEQDRE